MYIPKYYQIDDFQEIKNFIEKHNFAIIVSNKSGFPIATHVPVTITEKENNLYVSGHFAKGNEQSTTLDDSNLLVIFQGPHGYVSSTWYEQENVPTWNYQSVHIYGEGKILSEEELIEDLKIILNKYEGHRENGATWDNMSEKTRQQIKGIVGFEIKATKILAAYKLSQNRTEKDYKNIVENLKMSSIDEERNLADIMQQQISIDND